jgi:hypothetical protein
MLNPPCPFRLPASSRACACSHRERIAAEEASKEAALIAQFLAKCAEDDRKEQMARAARDEAKAVRALAAG